MASMLDSAPADTGVWSEPITAGIPDRWEFEKPGDSNQGVFLHSELVPVEGDKGFLAYDFRGDDGKLYGLLGSFSIDKAMMGVAVGTYVRLTFVGVQENPAKGKSAAKYYSIQIRKS